MSHKFARWLIPVVACLGLVVILWLPFGVKVSGIMEEWLVVHDVEHGGASDRNEDFDWFITTGTQRLRPLAATTSLVAYTLTPDSFVGYNLIAMALFASKGVLLYLILRRLTRGNTVFALLAGLLLIIFPADAGLFTFRAFNIHAAVVWFLLSVYLFLIYFETGRWWALVGAWVTTIGHLWVYEVGYPLVLVVPLLLVWLDGRLSRRVFRVGLLWYVAPVIALTYEAVLFTQGESYQSWLLQRSGLSQSSIAGEMFGSLLNAYNRHFVAGWAEALGQLATPYLALAVIAGAGAFAAGRLLPAPPDSDNKRRYWMLALVGFVAIGLGYSAFLITPYRQLDWRVYYYSSIGGAVCTVSLVYLAARYARLRQSVFVGAVSVLIGLATLHALNQHEYYAGLALNQQALLHDVVEQVPQLSGEATLVVVDETGRYNSNWSLGASYLVRYALGYVYANPNLDAILCAFDPTAGVFVTLPEQRELCNFAPSGITLTANGVEAGFYTYDRLAVVRYTDDGAELLDSLPPRYLTTPALAVYNPYQFVDTAASPPRRFYTMFSLPG